MSIIKWGDEWITSVPANLLDVAAAGKYRTYLLTALAYFR